MIVATLPKGTPAEEAKVLTKNLCDLFGETCSCINSDLKLSRFPLASGISLIVNVKSEVTKEVREEIRKVIPNAFGEECVVLNDDFKLSRFPCVNGNMLVLSIPYYINTDLRELLQIEFEKVAGEPCVVLAGATLERIAAP